MSECMYCGRDPGGEDACRNCVALLQDPDTALPLMRGHLTASLRGKMSKERLEKSIGAFLERMASLRPRRP